MITNKEEFGIKRKTRLDILEERIITAEKAITQLKENYIKEQQEDITKLSNVVSVLNDMKTELEEIQKLEEEQIDSEITNIKRESLLIINIEKIKIIEEREKLKKELEDYKSNLSKLQSDLNDKECQIEEERQKNKKLEEINSIHSDNINVLKSKAFGYDIAKKYETYKNDSSAKRQDHNPLEYNIWERENPVYIKQMSRLDDLAKEKKLWISNHENSINKLINDIQHSSGIGTNMRKYSPMIINSIKK
jgi:chromosome segregation ATPase